MSEKNQSLPHSSTPRLSEVPEYAKIVQELNAVCLKLSEIKHRMNACGRLPDEEFRRLSNERVVLIKERVKWETALSILRQERREFEGNNITERAKQKVAVVTDRFTTLLGRLVALRDTYRDAAKDPTRTPAVRHILSQVEQQMTKAMEG